MPTTETTAYDVTIQWTDETAEPGYRERVEAITIRAAGTEAAIEAAHRSRPSVSRVQLHGPHGATVAFQGGAFVRHYPT